MIQEKSETGEKLGKEKEKDKKDLQLYKIHKPEKTPLKNGYLCPKHPTANKIRMDKPLADNFRNLNITLHV